MEMRSHAEAVVGHLLAMQPFAPFDHCSADGLLRLLRARLTSVADNIEAGVESGPDQRLITMAEAWPEATTAADVKATLCGAFGMPEAPIDATGQFRPDWVLAHYSYRNHELFSRLLPHLESLGLSGLTDALAAITVCGEILSCIDPVTAHVEMDAFVTSALAAEPDIRAAVLQHLARTEPAMRRARTASGRAGQTVRDDLVSLESRADALADSYKRLVEGPFRQLVWARFSLDQNAWQKPPMLSGLLDRVVTRGGRLAQLASAVIIPELRNGEAHETLTWDGFAEVCRIEGFEVSTEQVVKSAHLAQCVVAGSEAGLAAVRFLDVPGEPPLLPAADEAGRMPGTRRVQAFFGTNRLRLLEANLNTRHATFRVERLASADINPCFQALVLSHRLMPVVESFSVSASAGAVTIAVDAPALSACMPTWEYAVANVDKIPLATFLAANLNARLRHERHADAVRSVAWIATDDALDAIDGSPTSWTAGDRALLVARLTIVEMAVHNAETLMKSGSTRLQSVAESVSLLKKWILGQAPERAHPADRLSEMVRLRSHWDSWGPVPRHPLIQDQSSRVGNERQPRLREGADSTAFRLL